MTTKDLCETLTQAEINGWKLERFGHLIEALERIEAMAGDLPEPEGCDYSPYCECVRCELAQTARDAILDATRY